MRPFRIDLSSWRNVLDPTDSHPASARASPRDFVLLSQDSLRGGLPGRESAQGKDAFSAFRAASRRERFLDPDKKLA